MLEASGVAEPSSIALTFLDEGLPDRIRVDSIMCVVDAEQVFAAPEMMELKLRQIAFADMLILNKVDLVTPEEIERIKAWLDDRFHRIRLVEACGGDVPLEILLSVGRFDPSQLDSPALDDHVDCADHGHAHDHSQLFKTWSYETDEPLSLEALQESARRLPASVYRCKGVVHTVEDPGRRTILQVVGKRVDIAPGGAWNDRGPAHPDGRHRHRRRHRRSGAARRLRRLPGERLSPPDHHPDGPSERNQAMTMTTETNTPLDELGPVDFLIVEFPPETASFTGEMAEELIKLVDTGTIRVIDLLVLVKDQDGEVEALEIEDLEHLGPLQVLEAELAELLAEDDVDAPRGRHGAGQRRRRAHLREPLGGALLVRRPPRRWAAHRQRAHPHPSHPRLRRSRRGVEHRRRLTCRSGQDVAGRVGVVGAPVAKAAVVGAAVRPGPAPVAKAAVVGAAVRPGPGRGRRRI